MRCCSLRSARPARPPSPRSTSSGGSPTIVGSDFAFTITTGSAATGCIATFNAAYANDPTCTVTAQDGTARAYTHSTTVLTLTVAAASAKYDVICVGH